MAPSPLQNSCIGERSKSGDKGLSSISNELASALNDGLYFYEQVEIHFAFYNLMWEFLKPC